jgi:hypothetical protein
MRTPSVLLGLRKLYRELLGERLHKLYPPKRLLRLKADQAAWAAQEPERRARLEEIETLLPHLEAVLRYLDPEWSPDQEKPTRPRAENRDLPPQGWSGAAMEALRRAHEPLTIAEIVKLVSEEHGLAMDTVAQRQKAHTAVNNALKHSFSDVLIRHPGRPDRFELDRDPG